MNSNRLLRARVPLVLVILILSALAQAGPPRSVVGVFEGRTPCGATAVQFTGFPSENCEKIKWRITFFQDAAGKPSTFAFKGTRATRQGKWTIERGAAANRNAVVYRLQCDPPGPSLLLMKVDDNLLLVMDQDRNLLVGNASWSYTLSRTDHTP